MASLAAGTCDIATIYSDARMHYQDRWTTDYGRTESIWDEAHVIGVTRRIANDGIIVNNEVLSRDFIEALEQAFINLSLTEEGAQVFDIYSHDGYVRVDDSFYDDARAAYDYDE